MKRAIIAILLLVIAGAAVFIVKGTGLLSHPALGGESGAFPSGGPPAGLEGNWQPGGAPIGGAAPIPPTEIRMGGQPQPRWAQIGPDSQPGIPVLTPAQIDQVLRSWTYPGATSDRARYIRPVESAAEQAKRWGNYTRFFSSTDPPAKVWRFYALKVCESIPAEYSQSDGGPPVSPESSTSMVMDTTKTGRFSEMTKSYMVSANLIYYPGQKHTDIVLLFSPMKTTPAPPPEGKAGK